VSPPIETVFDLIRLERERQSELWAGEHSWGSGDCSSQDVPDPVKAAVLAEECGEVARAMLAGDHLDLRRELVQVAAVAVAWWEALSEEHGR
jgi:hypothetical protein